MKKYYSLCVLAIAAMTAFSCTKAVEEIKEPEKVFEPKVISAFTDDDVTPDTKTSLSGVNILWATTDNIKGFDGTDVHTSTSTVITEGGKMAEFTFEALSVEDDLFFVAYPAENVSDIDEDYVYATIPSVQTATANSFANGANVAVADGGTATPVFKNVGGLLSFRINNDGITSVKLFADQSLTGTSIISTGNADFAEAAIDSGVNSVTLSGTIANGTIYYAVVYPGTYTGLKIEVTNTSGQVATYSNPNTLTVGRNANLFIAELTIPAGKWVTPTKGSEYVWALVSGDLGTSGNPSTSVTKGTPALTWSSDFTWPSSCTGFYLGLEGGASGRGLQVGKGSTNENCNGLVLSTSGYTEYVEAIRINFSHASSGGASVSVNVGGTDFKNEGNTSVSATTTATDYVFSGASLVKGDIVINFTNSAIKAFYIKSIVINPDDRTPVTLSFVNDAIEDQTTVSHTFTGQVVSSSPDVPAVTSNITWSITGDAITSSFNTSTGALVLSGTAGTATVTASFAGDENYKSAETSYSITVSKVKLATPTSPVAAEKSGDDAIVVTLPTGVSNVGSYSVTCTGETTQVVASGTSSVAFPSLSDGSYTVTVTAIPSDPSVYLESDAWSSSKINIGTPSHYAKITADGDLTDGDYLIVYESGSVAFNGGLSTLDAVSNTISVTITDETIAQSASVDAAAFTYNATKTTLKSASGYFIGQTSNANGLASSTSTEYTNAITFDDDGNANIVSSGGAYLRYNASKDQTRFRYFQSSTYTGQKAIQLYKKVSSN